MLLFAFIPLWRVKGRSATTTDQTLPRISGRKLWLFAIAAFVIGCSIGVARIYVGVHYPDDILGGAIDDLLAALIVTVVRRWLWRPTQAILRFAHTIWIA